MLRILGPGRSLASPGHGGVNRREMMRIGGLGLAGSLLDSPATSAAGSEKPASTFSRAKNCILIIHLRSLESARHVRSQAGGSRGDPGRIRDDWHETARRADQRAAADDFPGTRSLHGHPLDVASLALAQRRGPSRSEPADRIVSPGPTACPSGPVDNGIDHEWKIADRQLRHWPLLHGGQVVPEMIG